MENINRFTRISDTKFIIEFAIFDYDCFGNLIVVFVIIHTNTNNFQSMILDLIFDNYRIKRSEN